VVGIAVRTNERTNERDNVTDRKHNALADTVGLRLQKTMLLKREAEKYRPYSKVVVVLLSFLVP